jgi:hypothetical protein
MKTFLRSFLMTVLMLVSFSANAQTWTQIIDDQFGRSATSAGVAGSTTGVGNNWTDVYGNVWSLSGTQLIGYEDSGVSNTWQRDYLTRPTSENATNQRLVTYFTMDTNGVWIGALRRQTNGDCYMAWVLESGTPYIWKLTGSTGSPPNSGSATNLSGSSVLTFTPVVGHLYASDFRAVGTNPTTLSNDVYDLTALSLTALPNITTGLTPVGYVHSVSDSTSEFQGLGQFGLGVNTAGARSNVYFNEATTYTGDTISNATGYTITPSPSSGSTVALGGTVSLPISFTGSNVLGSNLVLTGTFGASMAGTYASTTSGVTISGSTITIAAGTYISSVNLTFVPSAIVSGGTITLTHSGGGSGFAAGGDPGPYTYTVTSGATGYTITPSPASGSSVAIGSSISLPIALTASNVLPTNLVLTGTLGNSLAGTYSSTTSGVTISGSTITVAAGTYSSGITLFFVPSATVSGGTITLSHSGGGSSFASGSDPGPYTYTVTTGPVTVLANDSHIYYSPGNWDVTGVRAQTQYGGAYIKANFTGTSFTLNLNNTLITAWGTGLSSEWPALRVSIDGLPFPSTDQIITNGSGAQTMALATGLASGSHHIEIYLARFGQANDRWTGPNDAICITSYTLDAGASILTATNVYSQAAIVYGDSITEGIRSLSTDATYVGTDSFDSWARLLCNSLGYEVGMCGFGGASWDTTNANNVPGLYNSPGLWNLQSAGVSRTFPSNLAWIFTNMGTNGGATAANIAAWILAVRTAVPQAKICFIYPFQVTSNNASIAAGIASYESSYPGDVSNVIAIGPDSDIAHFFTFNASASTSNVVLSLYSDDTLHPTMLLHQMLAPRLVRLFKAATTTLLKRTDQTARTGGRN